MSGPILPSIQMLSGGASSGKVLMVIGVLVALVLVAKNSQAATAAPAK